MLLLLQRQPQKLSAPHNAEAAPIIVPASRTISQTGIVLSVWPESL
jgi:hypothetical protein